MADIQQICRITGQPFAVSEAEQEHIRRIGESHPATGEPLPLPTVHPLEFHRQIYSFGNVYNLYWAKSALSGKPQLTRYDPERGYRICTLEEFWGDKIDNMEFGHDWLDPITESEAIRRGYDMAPLRKVLAGPNSLKAADTPAEIKDVNELTVCGKPIACAETSEVFSYQRKEIQFYQKFGIPLPTVHWRKRLRDLAQTRELIPAI